MYLLQLVKNESNDHTESFLLFRMPDVRLRFSSLLLLLSAICFQRRWTLRSVITECLISHAVLMRSPSGQSPIVALFYKNRWY